MGSRSVPKGRPIKGAPRIRGLCFEAGDDGVLHIETNDYHDPGVLSVEDQIRLAHWLLTRNKAAQAPALSPVDKAKNAWSDFDPFMTTVCKRSDASGERQSQRDDSSSRRAMHLSRRNIISIDVESNGLYGQPFCVGAVEMDWGGRVISEFLAKCPLDQVEDEWVLEHVIPALEGTKETHKSWVEMQLAFVLWMVEAMKRNANPIVLVDVGFPVDCKFLYDAIYYAAGRNGTMDSWIREKYSPYPLLDLASILAGAGLDPDTSRLDLAMGLRSGPPSMPLLNEKAHHPVWDAETSALCLVQVIRMLEERDAVHHS